jgi:prepilin-type N-terminal cleavage/methylation domain-containing protein
MLFSQEIRLPPSMSGAPRSIGVFSSLAGFTLPELIATIAILAILSAVAIESYSNLQESARESVARDTVSILNRALLHFNQANWDIVLNAVPGSTSDELAVLRTLQWRDPDPAQATPGSPYMPANFSEAVSSSEDDYRIRWNGHTFELLEPGTAGSGLKTDFDSTSVADAYSFPEDYQPLGPGQHE